MTADRLYQVSIAATPEETWAALTDPDRVRNYYFDTAVRTTWEVGAVIATSPSSRPGPDPPTTRVPSPGPSSPMARAFWSHSCTRAEAARRRPAAPRSSSKA